MRHQLLVRVLWLAVALLGGLAGAPRASYAGLVGPADQIPASLRLGQSKKIDLGHGFYWLIMRPDDAFGYAAKQVSWSDELDLVIDLAEIIGGVEGAQAAGILQSANPTTLKVIAGAAKSKSLANDALTFLRATVSDEAYAELEYMAYTGADFNTHLIGILHYKSLPLLCWPCSAPPAAMFRTNKGCGNSFYLGETVIAYVGLPYDATVTVLLELRDGGFRQPLVSGLSLSAGQAVGIPVPANWLKVAFWKIRLGATDSKGVFHSDSCNFAVTAPDTSSPPTPTPGGTPGGGTPGGTPGGTTGGQLIEAFWVGSGSSGQQYHRENQDGDYGFDVVFPFVRLSRPAKVTMSGASYQLPAGTQQVRDGIVSEADGPETFQITATDGKVTETASYTIAWIDDPNWLPNTPISVTFTPDGAQVSWTRTSDVITNFDVIVESRTPGVVSFGATGYLPSSQTSVFVPLSPTAPAGTQYKANVEAIDFQTGWWGWSSSSVLVTR